jgi:hypothetical protein
MNCGLTSRVKPLLVYLVPVALISPSLIWTALDKSVWMWDEAIYGKGSVELFYTLSHSPKRWLRLMLHILHEQAPGVSWLGQFFVPLGYLLGSIDVSLLLSILVTQALTLVLIYRSVRELSGHNRLVSIGGCLVIASAPLFVAMSHQYLAEPLQLLAVTWFVLIMSFAPKWPPAFILSQILVATAVAMSAKVSSPLYCLGPGLVAFWYVFKPEPSSFIKHEWLQKRVIVTLAAGALLSLAAMAWYYQNITYVMQHVSDASTGPIAEIYGKKDTFLDTLIYWLGSVQNSFFLPIIFFLMSLVFGLAVIHYLTKPKTLAKHFTLCSLTAVFQITIVLGVFSFSSNRELRYLLPLLPYLSLIICWSLAQINRPALTGLAILFFLVQLASAYGQALGILSLNPTTPWWLLVPNAISGQKESIALNAIVAKTCTDIGPQPYLNVIGIEKPWLNEHSANYLAAKHRVLHKPIGCRYGSFGYETDLDKIWNNILSKTRYYITVNPNSNPVPSADAHLQAINKTYLPILQKVRNSASFELQPALDEDPTVWIFRRKEMNIY